MEQLSQTRINKTESLYENIQCNGIFINQDSSLLSIATDKGFKIFETYNFIQISEEDEIQDLIGSLKIAIPFYESYLIMLVGKNENSIFAPNHLVIWNDIKKMKIGMIMLNDKIIDAKIFKDLIYILIPQKILLFGTRNLNYIYAIYDVDAIKMNNLLISADSNPNVIINIPLTRSNQLKITKLIINSDEIRKLHLVITTPFRSIYKINLSKKGDSVIVIGNYCNKIHIYSLIDFQLKFCLDSEFEQQKILNISISKKSKFFSIFYRNLNLEIYNLSEEKKINQNCDCMIDYMSEQSLENNFTDMNKQENMIIKNSDLNTKSSSYNSLKIFKGKAKKVISNVFDKFKSVFFVKNRKSFCKYKFNSLNDEMELESKDVFNLMPSLLSLVLFPKINELVRYLLLKFISLF